MLSGEGCSRAARARAALLGRPAIVATAIHQTKELIAGYWICR